MDRRGRRRRLFTVLGAAFGLLLTAGGALLVAGLVGWSPGPLPGLPGGRQGLLERGDVGGGGVVPASAPGSRVRTSAPPAGRAVTGASTGPAPAGTTTTTRPGNRPASKPGNPKPTRTR
ncbi:hypothetical protein ACQP1P_19360 [Dactylosporangium sp. CA-052675]|uniref:hypothetical protein n=1 Tax=Dactylosporangium sp. CA-052675 TaxID=3239927 RepID=UPI003D89D1FA